MPKWGIHVSMDQLGHPAASLRNVVQLAKAFNRDAALVILGTYNLALSLSALREHMDGGQGERLAAQQALLRNSISERRLRELKDKLGNADLVLRVSPSRWCARTRCSSDTLRRSVTRTDSLGTWSEPSCSRPA